MREFLLAVLLVGCAAVAFTAATADEPFAWRLPRGFPSPRVPPANPMSVSKVTLGRYLFYDRRLSRNGQQSCGTCHEQARAFTDGRAHARGSTGEEHPRSSMSLVNVAYASVLTWGNPTVTKLEEQALVPMFGDHPVELGLTKPGTELLGRLRRVPEYERLFPAAFNGANDPFTVENVTRAIASFERTIISGRSSYDRYHFDRQDDAISVEARRGEQLFFSAPLSCFRCHGGFTFSGAVDFEGRQGGGPPEFHNNGLANLAGGVYDVTGLAEDFGKFKAPTLRNIAVTAPYMHDGNAATLEAVLDFYAAGGRDQRNKSDLVHGFPLTVEQKHDLIAFLQTLTDTELLRDPDLSNPWSRQGQEAR
jgi:cytochrome c peroxidase